MGAAGRKCDRIEEKGKEMRRMEDYHRHDLSDEAWERLEEKLPGRRGMWGVSGKYRITGQFGKPIQQII